MESNSNKMSTLKTSVSGKIEKLEILKDKYNFKLISKEEIVLEKIKGYELAI